MDLTKDSIILKNNPHLLKDFEALKLLIETTTNPILRIARPHTHSPSASSWTLESENRQRAYLCLSTSRGWCLDPEFPGEDLPPDFEGLEDLYDWAGANGIELELGD